MVRLGWGLLGSSMILVMVSLWDLSSGVIIIWGVNLGGMFGFEVDFGVVVDWISLLFYSEVLFISGLILLYSVEYMSGGKWGDYFSFLMWGFVLSMGVVVFSGNLVTLLLGWDWLGLTSFCLVIFYQNNGSLNAGIITIMYNKLGDVAMLISFSVSVGVGVELMMMGESEGWEELVFVGLVLAGLTKSAQIPFSAWLPCAMAAPTPVSSLVHSSTLVAAGVFLLVRVGEIFVSGGMMSVMVMILGILTMIMAGIGANFEMDFSSVVALSTLSQLGVMMIVLSVGFWKLAYFHMMTHAMFSALMFMCVGVLIKVFGGSQDLRVVGASLSYFPLVGIGLSISSLALLGFPFLTGFYSKDLILEKLLVGSLGSFGLFLVVVSFGLTILYSYRLMFGLMVVGEGKGKGVVMFAGEYMNYSIGCLMGFSVFGGSVLMWLLMEGEYEIMSSVEKLMGVILVLVGLWLSRVVESVLWVSGLKSGVIMNMLGGMWFLSSLSGNEMVNVVGAGRFYLNVDGVWGEIVGGSGLKKILVVLGGVLEYYVFMGFSGFLFLVVLFLLCLGFL